MLQDNLEFIQWLYSIFLAATPGGKLDNYDPVSARSKCKGVTKSLSSKNGNASTGELRRTSSAAAKPTGAGAGAYRLAAASQTMSAAQLKALKSGALDMSIIHCKAGGGASYGTLRRPLTSLSSAPKNNALPKAPAPPATPVANPVAATSAGPFASPTSAFISAFTTKDTSFPFHTRVKETFSTVAATENYHVPSLTDPENFPPSGTTTVTSQSSSQDPTIPHPTTVLPSASTSASVAGLKSPTPASVPATNSTTQATTAPTTMLSPRQRMSTMPVPPVPKTSLLPPAQSDDASTVAGRFSDELVRLTELRELVSNIEREKEFYLAKMFALEKLFQRPEYAGSELSRNALTVLYATQTPNVQP